MVGTPQLQMFFGFVVGAFSGVAFAWDYHPTLAILGLPAGGVIGFLYAGLGCYVCGSTLDSFADSLRKRRCLSSAARLLIWLAISFIVFALPLLLIKLALHY